MRGAPSGWRVAWAEEVAATFRADGRRTLLDVGAGPGTDAASFRRAGIDPVGVDLAIGNASLAARAGATVVPASLFDLPFPDRVFDAGWSMSTLMHVPVDHVDAAISEVCRVLRPGAPLVIGQWGGSLGDIDSEATVPGFPRLFSLRSADHNHALLARHGTIERWETRDAGADGWEYHLAVIGTLG